MYQDFQSPQAAVILAAGLGTRLGPLTERMPKCLVPVQGRAVLEWAMRKLMRAGVRHFFVNTHHCAEQVEAFLKQKNFFDAQVMISPEKELLDTGGALARMQGELSAFENFYLHNADILSNVDLLELAQAHDQSPAIATLVCRESEEERRLLFDEHKALVGWENRKTAMRKEIRSGENFGRGFCGISILQREIFQFFPKQAKFSIIDAWLKAAESHPKNVLAHVLQAGTQCYDIGTPEELLRVERINPASFIHE